MSELAVLAACLKDRRTYELTKQLLDVSSLAKEFQVVMSSIGSYYDKDSGARSAVPEVIVGVIEATFQNPKHRKQLGALVAEAAALDVSVANVNEMLIAAKRRELAAKLSVSLVNNDGKDAALMEEYKAVLAASSVEDLLKSDSDLVVITSATIHDMLTAYISNEGAFQVYPRALNEQLKGRLNSGHHWTIFAPPEVGKTALVCTITTGFARQKRRGIIFGNEDRNEDYYFRLVSSLTGLSLEQITAAPNTAIEKAIELGLDNITFIGMSPGNTKIIRSIVEKEQPEWFCVDQMINLNEKGDGLSQILGKASREIRSIGKDNDTLAVSICQGGDSGVGKAVLEQGDVYMSNTEVPANCDVLTGIGGTREMLMRNERTVTFCKNKVGGAHETVPLQIVPEISRYVSRT